MTVGSWSGKDLHYLSNINIVYSVRVSTYVSGCLFSICLLKLEDVDPIAVLQSLHFALRFLV